MTKSLRLAWIPRLLYNDEEWSEVFKTIPNHCFDSYGGLNFLLRCNHDLKFLEQTGMPQFYKTMLQFFFYELKSSYTKLTLGKIQFYLTTKIFLLIVRLSSTNRGSRKEFSEFTTSSRRVVLFFSHSEFTKRYNLNCSFLQYLQVVSAIPKRSLEKAKQNLNPKFTFSQDNTFFQLSSIIKGIF